jgi:hypothetical protein
MGAGCGLAYLDVYTVSDYDHKTKLKRPDFSSAFAYRSTECYLKIVSLGELGPDTILGLYLE